MIPIDPASKKPWNRTLATCPLSVLRPNLTGKSEVIGRDSQFLVSLRSRSYCVVARMLGAIRHALR